MNPSLGPSLSPVLPSPWFSSGIGLSCFRLVPRGKLAVAGCGCWASFCAHAAIFGLVSKVVVFTSCVTLRAVIFYVS